ncbi:hypothetical protein, partial [Escherichia coli]|uniref:hypothetical protein n=2 Tax=Escherichia coli TaxID=562 RepID=UPI001BFEAA3A
GDRDTRSQWISVATEAEERYLMGMATSTLRGIETSSVQAAASPRALPNRRFLMVASLKPVTKRATITSTQADKAVRYYLAAQLR